MKNWRVYYFIYFYMGKVFKNILNFYLFLLCISFLFWYRKMSLIFSKMTLFLTFVILVVSFSRRYRCLVTILDPIVRPLEVVLIGLVMLLTTIMSPVEAHILHKTPRHCPSASIALWTLWSFMDLKKRKYIEESI